MIVDLSLMIFSNILLSDDGAARTGTPSLSPWTILLGGLPSIASTAEISSLKKWDLPHGRSSMIQVCTHIVLACVTTKSFLAFPMIPSSMLVGNQATYGGVSTGPSLFPSEVDFDWDDPAFYALTPEEMGLPPDGSCVNHLTTAPPLPPGSIIQQPSLVEINPGNIPVQKSHEATWAGHNAARPVIKPRTPPRPLTEADKNSRKIAKEQKQSADKLLQEAIKNLFAEQNAKIEAIAKEHNVQPKRVRKLLVGTTHYQPNRKVQLYNALISAKAQEVNAGKVLLLFVSDTFT